MNEEKQKKVISIRSVGGGTYRCFGGWERGWDIWPETELCVFIRRVMGTG